MKISLNKKSEVYILAPAKRHTGGPELLHQLCNQLNSIDVKAFMTYHPQLPGDPVHNNYKRYNINIASDLPDKPNTYIVLPEIYAHLASQFKKSKVIIWWLSVDNFFVSRRKISAENLVLRYLKYKTIKSSCNESSIFSNDNIHLVQSHYAKEFLESKGVDNVQVLSDYLAPKFLEENKNYQKEDYICFNPKKGKEFTDLIIAQAKGIKFVPLVGFSQEQMKEVLGKAKLYIDFGEHPGKDRIPREAAKLGCCVIVGKRGSASNKYDVPLKEKYKFKVDSLNVDAVIGQIQECFGSFDDCSKDFDSYREKIMAEPQKFQDDVSKIFTFN